MKTVKSYILGIAAAAAVTMGFAACQDDFETPNLPVPEASEQPNISIADLKELFWKDDANYVDTVKTREDGTHYIFAGRVISSDEQSNVFKNISIQDATGAITFSVNSYNLYLNYRVGQEIVVDATGMFIGKYAGLQQFGAPSYYENGSTWQVGFMSPELFKTHIQLNGNPEVAKIDTIVVNSIKDLDTTPEGLRKWQSQLVRINNVHFEKGGEATFSEYHSNDNDIVNKTLIDAEGNNIIVRTSGYATFWNKTLPKGDGDIVGVLSFYQNLAGSSMWQLVLNDYEGCMNFGNPTIAPGASANNPYTVDQAIAVEQGEGAAPTAWVAGYIVGTVAPGVEAVASNDDIEWSGESQMPYTLVIGADKDTKDIAHAIVVNLPADSPLRQYGNLRDNPANYGKAIKIRGELSKVMDTYGVVSSGAASQFEIEGLELTGDQVPEGDGTQAKPYNATQATAQAIANGTTSTDKVYVAGYVKSGEISSQYGTGTWVISDKADGTGGTFELYATYDIGNGKFTDLNKVKVGDLVVACGPIYNYNGKTPEMSKGYLVSINGGNGGGGETPDPGETTGAGTEDNPYTVADIRAMPATSTKDVYLTGVWATGYIVGYIPTGTTTTDLNITKFSAEGAIASNMVIAATPTETDYNKCIAIQLVSGSDVRKALNLMDNPDNLGKQVSVFGDVYKYCGAPGIKSTSAYKLDGQSGGNTGGNTGGETGDGTPEGNGTVDSPYNATAATAKALANGSSSTENVYVAGYVVEATYNSKYSDFNLKITDKADLAGVQFYMYGTKSYNNSAFTSADQLKVGDYIVAYGPIYTYNSTTPEMSRGHIYSINGQVGEGGGDNPGGDDPVVPSGDYKGDFNSFNNGATATAYKTYTNATGWTAENCAILGGAEAGTNSNPNFAFIGPKGTLAPTMTGKTTTPGKIVSPVITGGIGKLTFNYGFPFNDTNCSITINIKQNGSVVKTATIERTDMTKLTAYDYSLDVNVTGEFSIEFVNNCPSEVSDSNKDRVAIWNLTWTD